MIQKMKNNQKETIKSRTLSKAIQILDAFSENVPDWGVRHLAEQVSLSPSTVYRILTTFCEYNYLIKDPKSRRYSLGPSILKLASSYSKHNPLHLIANQIFNQYKDRWPCTALGKALLSFQSDDFIQKFINEYGLIQYTSNTITNPDELWEQIQEIRKNGFSINEGEFHEHIAAIGAPIYNSSLEVVASISLVYPRLEDNEHITRVEKMAALIKEISEEITMRYSGVSIR